MLAIQLLKYATFRLHKRQEIHKIYKYTYLYKMCGNINIELKN